MTKPRATSKPPSMYRAPTTASKVSAMMDCFCPPPLDSSPFPSKTRCSNPSRRATSARALPLTSGERSLVSSPSGRSGKSSKSRWVTASSTTESPRNSSRSFESM